MLSIEILCTIQTHEESRVGQKKCIIMLTRLIAVRRDEKAGELAERSQRVNNIDAIPRKA